MKNFIARYAVKHQMIFVCLGYTLLALTFTFPVIAHLNTEIPKGGGDVYQVISSIDIGVNQVKASGLVHGAVFLIKKLNVFTPYILLDLIFNKFAAYNILFLLTYILSGVGMFLLARHFAKNFWAAFLAGIIYAFSPFHFYQSVSVHLGTMQQQWVPFFVLFLFLFFEERFKFKHFIGICFFAFLIAMVEHQMLAFTMLFVTMVVAYEIYVDKSILKNKKLWAYVLCSAGLLATVAFVMFGDMLKVATSDNNFLDAGAGAANKYSIALLDPIAPPIFHSIWPGISEFLQNIMLGGTNRGSYFVGFSVLGVLVYFAYLLKKKRVALAQEQKYRQDVMFWSFSSLLFYVFSLGNSFDIGKFTIYLPYFLIYKFLPFYNNIRTTGRMFMFVELGVSLLFAYGFTQLLKKYPQKNILLAGTFSVIILLEFWVAPIPTMVVSYSPFYDQLAKDTQKYKIIEIPGSTSYEFASYAMFTASVHGKIDLNGMPLARKISGEFEMQQNTPVVKQLLYTIGKGNDPDTKDETDIIAPFDYSKANDVLSYYDVRYITISKLYASSDVLTLAQKFIEKHISYDNKYEDKYLVAYAVKQVQPEGFYTRLDESTSDFYSQDFAGENGHKNREFGNGGGIKIVNIGKTAQKVKITVNVKGASGLIFSSPMNIETNNALALSNTEKQYTFSATLLPGDNSIPFFVRDADGKAVDISTNKKTHQAAVVSQISVAAQN